MDLNINNTETTMKNIKKSLAQFFYDEDIKLEKLKDKLYHDILKDLYKQLKDGDQNYSRQIDNYFKDLLIELQPQCSDINLSHLLKSKYMTNGHFYMSKIIK